MIGLPFIYTVAGLVFLTFAALSAADAAHPKRFGNAAFYALIAVSFLAGDRLGDVGNGILVLALVAIAGVGGVGRGNPATTSAEERRTEADRRRDRLFLPALVIPVVALGGTFLFKAVPGLVDPRQATLVALTIGTLAALAILYAWLRPRPLTPFHEGRRLMDGIGWAAVLPQMLASLGAVFALAGVGEVVGGLVGGAIPEGSRLGAVIAYGIGMTLFTMAMGNAFAAFPVMMAAVGMPLLVRQYGGDPAMLAGFCGTLMTPMAANFNLVPAALLELRDRNAVIKRQIATALPLLVVNIGLIHVLAF
jgi:uncharacterized membrane protein